MTETARSPRYNGVDGGEHGGKACDVEIIAELVSVQDVEATAPLNDADTAGFFRGYAERGLECGCAQGRRRIRRAACGWRSGRASH